MREIDPAGQDQIHWRQGPDSLVSFDDETKRPIKRLKQHTVTSSQELDLVERKKFDPKYALNTTVASTYLSANREIIPPIQISDLDRIVPPDSSHYKHV